MSRYRRGQRSAVQDRRRWVSPRHIEEELRKALDPSQRPAPVKSFKNMTPEEQARMRALYEGKS